MDRRGFLKRLGIGVGVVTIAPTALIGLKAQAKKKPSQEVPTNKKDLSKFSERYGIGKIYSNRKLIFIISSFEILYTLVGVFGTIEGQPQEATVNFEGWAIDENKIRNTFENHNRVQMELIVETGKLTFEGSFIEYGINIPYLGNPVWDGTIKPIGNITKTEI